MAETQRRGDAENYSLLSNRSPVAEKNICVLRPGFTPLGFTPLEMHELQAGENDRRPRYNGGQRRRLR